MKKTASFLFFILALSLSAACSPQYSDEITPSDTNVGTSVSDESSSAIECSMPIYFDSEEQLLKTIYEVKSKTNADDSCIIIESIMASTQEPSGKPNKVTEQVYYASSDEFKLASISEFCRPKGTLREMSFLEIHVMNYYVSYWYANEDHSQIATFTWSRGISPEVAMNALNGKEVEYNGIKYVVEERFDSEMNQSSSFTIHWVADGKPYTVFVPTGYTEDEVLEFCEIEAVPVK